MSELSAKMEAVAMEPEGKTYPEAESGSSVYYRSVGRVWEILAVVSLALCVFIYGLELGKSLTLILTVLLLVFSFSMYRLAIKFAISASRVEKALAAEFRYKVTDARLKTLRAAGVPQDVRDALRRLKEQSPLPEKEFLSELALNPHTDLGWERTNEFREQILKYTKVYSKSPTPSSEA